MFPRFITRTMVTVQPARFLLTAFDSFRISQRTLPFMVRSNLPTQSYKYFHTSKSLNALPPLLWMMFKPVAKFTAILTGRGFRKWWQSLPKNKRLYFIGVIRKNKVKIAGSFAVPCALSVAYYVSHLQQVPFTGRRRFVAFTPEEFKQISEFEYQTMKTEYESKIIPHTHRTHQRVLSATKRILDSNLDVPQIRDQKWAVVVVDDPTENAFVLPSGHIFVFTGMLELCTNESQLGVVIAHEMAHAILSHGSELISFTHLLDLGTILALGLIWALLPSDFISVLTQFLFNKVASVVMHLPYNRMLENEADEVGLQLTAKACFDVRESSAFWNKLSILATLKGETDIEWFSTHPTHENRSQKLDQLMPHAIEIRSCSKCSKLDHSDPRDEMTNFKEAMMRQLAAANNGK